MRAVVYTRISRDKEGLELGVARQRDDCLELARRAGYEVVEVFQDNDSGASTRSRTKIRPAYTRMLREAKEGRFKVIVAYTSSRLTRRPREHEDLIELGERHRVRFLYVRSPSFDLNTADGRRIARILAANDTGEAEQIGERVERKALERAQAGLPAGGHRAVGYERDGITIRPDEARLIKQGYQRLLTGGSLRGIARQWNAAGFRNSWGGTWRPDSVRDVLLRARSCGLREYRREVLGRAQWKGIVDEDTWRTTVALLRDEDRRTATTNRRAYLLSGLAICGVCGAHMDTGRTQHGVRTYKCSKSRHLSRGAAPIEELVASVVVARLSRPDAIDLLIDEDRPNVAALREEVQVCRSRLEEVAALFADGTLTAAQLATSTGKLRARLAEIEAQMAHAGRVDILGNLVKATKPQKVWEAMDVDQRRRVIDVMMTIKLLSPGRGARTFRSESVEITWRQS